MEPSTPAITMRWAQIGKPIFRIIVCIATVYAVTAVLYIVPLRDRARASILAFLLVTLIFPALWGFRYALFALFLTAVGFSWLLPPVGHLWLSNPRDVFTLAGFLVVGAFGSYLSARSRKEALNANQRHAEAVAEQQRFRDLVNSVEGIVWEADAETFAFTFVSSQAERILGYPPEQWLREPSFWKDHLHPDDRDFAVQFCVEATAAKRSHDFQYRMIAADGRVVWLRDLVTVVVENGRATQLRGVMIDVTQRKQNEEALREQANLLDLTHDAILVRDVDGVIKYWNRAAEALYGWPAEQASDKVVKDLLKTVFPEPLEQITQEVMRTGRWEGELAHTRKNGTTVIVASRWSLQRDDHYAPIAILETNNDITAAKLTELAREEIDERWRAAFKSNPTMYFIVDAAGSIVSVNAFGAEQLGYNVDELIGQPVLSVFYEPDRAAVQEHATSCFNQPGRMMRWEARKIRKDGTMIWVRETANAVFLKKRPVLLVVCEDITQQKRAEEAVRRSEKELRDVIETIPAIAFCHRPDGSAEFVNRWALEYIGLSAETVSGDGWQSAIHPEDRDTHLKKWHASMATGQLFENEARHRSAKGEYRWFLVRAMPLRDEHGNILRWYGTGIDIEDRKRAEEAVRRSEAHLAEAQRLSRTGSWVYRPGIQKAVYWSEEMFRIWGFDPQQGLPDNEAAWQRIHPEDLKAFLQEQIEQAATGSFKADLLNEFRIVLPDGTVKHLQGTSHPVFDQAGNVVEYVGTSMDVTERKRAESALRESEELKRRIIESSTDCIKVLDLDGNLLYMSSGGQQLLEIDDIQLYLNTCWVDFWQPDDRPKISEAVAAARAGGIGKFQAFCPSAKGAPRWWDVVVTPICNADGQPEQLLSVSRDITDRKRAEEEVRAADTRFRTFVDHATDALFVHDEQGNIVEANRQACEGLGYTRQELMGASPSIFDPRADAAFHRWVRERLETGGICTFESSHRRKDGTVFPVEVRLRPFTHGGQQFALALVRDITDAKCAEAERERLRQLEADLARINRVTTMGELTASLAHEINQPIAATVTNANTSVRWLAGDVPNIEEAREAAKRAAKDANRAAEIINRIRSLFRKGAPQRELVDVNQIIDEMVMMLLRTEGDRSAVSIRGDLAADLPPIMGDRVQLQQVVLNLMMNGIDAMKNVDGAHSLTIASRRNGNEEIVISVSDVGVGLPADTGKLFDAFFTTKPHGTGMGLAISRSIIEAHGGRLWASSNSGPGATFSFALPMKTEG